MRLHHVQVSMPRGGEDEARRFYRDALGMTEVEKPPGLAGRGGCWFRAFGGFIRFHTRDGFGNRLEIMTPL